MSQHKSHFYQIRIIMSNSKLQKTYPDQLNHETMISDIWSSYLLLLCFLYILDMQWSAVIWFRSICFLWCLGKYYRRIDDIKTIRAWQIDQDRKKDFRAICQWTQLHGNSFASHWKGRWRTSKLVAQYKKHGPYIKPSKINKRVLFR